jgi:Na+/proline symporter
MHYSLGRRLFTTPELVFTILATWASGSGFFIDVTEFYFSGFQFLIPSLGMVVCLGLVSFVIVPRSKDLLGCISGASFMKEKYGNTTQIITAIATVVGVSGSIAIQLKILCNIGNFLYPGINEYIFIVAIGIYVGWYTYVGGIRSVIHTDFLQSICFLISIGSLMYFLTKNTTIQYVNPSHQFTNLFHQPWETWQTMLLLLAYYAIPGMNAATIQRISIGINLNQTKISWAFAAVGFLGVLIACNYIGYLVYQNNPHLTTSDQIFTSLVTSLEFPGLKALLFLGIICMGMSTADSFLNIASVTLSHDLFARNKNSIKQLKTARISTIIVVALSIGVALFPTKKLLDIILATNSFYMPIVTVPLLAAIFYKPVSERSCLIAMGVSFCVVVVVKYILWIDINIIAIAMCVNLFVLIASHYILDKWELLKPIGITSRLKGKK